MRIAVITYQDRGSYAVSEIPDEDLMVEEVFNQLDLEFEFAVWSDPQVDWTRFDLLLLKSPWDYFDQYPLFLDWCHKIQQLKIPVLNDLDTVIWNSDKKYLNEIAESGLKVIPSHFHQAGQEIRLESFFDKLDTDILVIKPTVSGGAKDTYKLNREALNQKAHLLLDLAKTQDLLIQPFVKEVAETGEYSYIFFNGAFSHAILKRPKSGEFRVQHFFGGTVEKVIPDSGELELISKYVVQFATDCLYARVDGVWIGDEFFLMELELIEPYLFLFTDAKALEQYKVAIQQKIAALGLMPSLESDPQKH